MRIKSYENGGYKKKDDISSGGAMTGPLYLYELPPEKDMEAITKQYVDSMLSSFSADKFTSGTLPVGRLPGFAGDITSTNGSNVLSLKNNIVTPGIYTKIAVNDKGLVVDGFALSTSDVPDIDWSKVDSDRPVTLAGYGITDAISKSGGEITGNLTLSADPTNDEQLASKQYSDTKTLSSGELEIGDMIAKAVSENTPGFLRCNGASVSRDVYGPLYAVIGDTYGVTLITNSGKPWRSQYQLNTSQTDAVTGWATGTALPGILTHSQAIVTKNRVYLVGGRNSAGTPVATVYTAAINADGTLGAWTTGTSLPGALANSQAVVVKNRAYLLGGVDTNGITSVIYVAPINADGTLGTWVSNAVTVTTNISGTNTITIPAGVTTLNVIGRGGTGTSTSVMTDPGQPYIAGSSTYSWVYYGTSGPGGSYSATQPPIYSYPPGDPAAYPGSDTVIWTSWDSTTKMGEQQTWRSTVTGTSGGQPYIPPTYSTTTTTGASSTFTINGTTYTYPGGNGGAATPILTVINLTGAAPVTANYSIASGVTSTVYYFDAGSAGTQGVVLPGPLANSQALITNDRLYMFGGTNTNNGTSTSIVYTSKIQEDGSLGLWEGGTSLPQPLSSAQAISTNNKIYLLGGYNSTTNSNTNAVYYATIGSDGVLNNWVTATNLPAMIAGHQAIVTKNRVQIFGGKTTAGASINSSYSAPINADGTIGTWATATNLSVAFTNTQAVITSSKIYLLGGTTSTPVANVYVAPMTGGLNDYSPYYNGTFAGVDTSTFVLPDLSTKELAGTYTYIKYIPKA